MPEPIIHHYFHIIRKARASDLHIAQGSPPKMRVHGAIRPIEDEILDGARMEAMLKEVCEPRAWQRFVEKGDLDFAYEMDADARFRVNYLKQSKGYAAVFRLIPTELQSLESLGIPAVVEKFGTMRSGLVLCTGPTGSGKSTTLASLVDHINTNYSRHIVTIEEPIEFVHNNKKSIITQREVPIQTPSYADGLRACLREDADIVLVGEMRDLRTISLALTAAETGLLVFGTLHTNNARKTVDRLVDVFPSEQQSQVRTMLAASLRGVVAQLLLKNADGKGRCCVCEIMFSTPAVASIIREGASQKLQDVIVGGKAFGMQFMDDDIMKRLDAGIVSPMEAYLKAIEKKRFKEFLPAEHAAMANAGGS
jgi:twitching motility protein PilT